MFFLLQKENDYDIDTLLFKNILDKNKYLHHYESLSIKELADDDVFAYPDTYKSAIPIGSIKFVERWLYIFHKIAHIYPIEIPKVLREERFLKRKYSIRKKEDMPTTGSYFIKDASKLKVFSFCGNVENFLTNGIWEEKKSEFDNSLRLNPKHLYQVSEKVDILSEYRVYIISGEIEVVAHYDGDPLIFPDINLIKEANLIYSTQKSYPKSYSLDVMVTNKGTSIIEIHNFHSLGLYSTLFGDNLAYAYRDGIDFIIRNNSETSVYSNF